MMDSPAIATELERRYPSPPLHLDSETLPEVEALFSKFVTGMRGVLFPKYPPMLLNEPSREYFVRTREETFGMSLGQLEKEEGGEKAWEKTRPVVEELGRVLRKEGGPFVLGKEGERSFSLRFSVRSWKWADGESSVVCRFRDCGAFAVHEEER
jgi:hypothetical protein